MLITKTGGYANKSLPSDNYEEREIREKIFKKKLHPNSLGTHLLPYKNKLKQTVYFFKTSTRQMSSDSTELIHQSVK